MKIAIAPEHIARICHEANKAWCEINGDPSQPTWYAAERWQKEAAIAGVKYILSNPGATPEVSHIEWMKQMQEQGWTYGEKKDQTLKQHPSMVPYDQLPAAKRLTDYLYCGIVNAFLQMKADQSPMESLNKAIAEAIKQ